MLLSSCESDEAADGLKVDGNRIAFVADIPGVPGVSAKKRTIYDLSEQIPDGGITVSAFWTEMPDGPLEPYFQDKIATLDVDGAFRSSECTWPPNVNDNNGCLKFFVFHPSRDEMKRRAGVGDECFIYSNSTEKTASGIDYDYRLTKFRVAPNIAQQVDFVTAIGEGNKTQHLYSGVEFAFEHQLCGVELSAWGANTLYDIEVAGWRVGGIVVEADFGLSTEVANPGKDENSIGEWFINNDSPRGYVDYVFAREDKVVRINASEHNTKETAVSLLGRGGRAMVIPQKQDMWDHTNDKTTSPKGMYFSALVRITQHDGDHHRIYPSTDPESQDDIVYLSVRKSDGTVMERLDKYGNVYGSSTKYDIPDTEELRHYGWAAAPAKVDWKAGYYYSYVLDYSNGVGVHDPYDPNPGGPMIDWGGVEVTTTTGEWSNGAVISEGSWGSNSNNTGPDGTVWWK